MEHKLDELQQQQSQAGQSSLGKQSQVAQLQHELLRLTAANEVSLCCGPSARRYWGSRDSREEAVISLQAKGLHAPQRYCPACHWSTTVVMRVCTGWQCHNSAIVATITKPSPPYHSSDQMGVKSSMLSTLQLLSSLCTVPCTSSDVLRRR